VCVYNIYIYIYIHINCLYRSCRYLKAKMLFCGFNNIAFTLLLLFFFFSCNNFWYVNNNNSVFPSLVSASTLRSKSFSFPSSSSDFCDLTHGSWVQDLNVKKHISLLNQTSDRPAETYANYDCSMRLSSLRMPDIDHYSQTLPFCERINDTTLKRIAQESVEWNWLPHDCKLEDINGEKLAKYLAKTEERPAGRWLYFVGDSTLLHMYDSLICLLGKTNVDVVESEYAQEELDATFHKLPKIYSMKKVGVVALNGGGRIYFLRSNHLVSEVSGLIDGRIHKINRVLIQHVVDGDADIEDSENDADGDAAGYIEDLHYHEMEIPWIRQIRHKNLGKDDILIFNAGFHGGIHKDLVQHVLHYFSEYFYGRLIYRTNIPGSYECLKDKIKDKSSGPLHQHWNKFEEWDKLWREESKAISNKLEIMDITEMSTQRRGNHPVEFYGHTNCLHFCLPGGPVDAWNKILYNLLLQPNTRMSK
jgi:hypothetical protein